MFKPYPYDDLSAINSPKFDKSIIDSISCGMKETVEYLYTLIDEKLKSNANKCVIAIDGYSGVEFEQLIKDIQEKYMGNAKFKLYGTYDLFKPASVLEQELEQYLPQDRAKDPVLLFGSLYKGGYEGLFDNAKIQSLKEELENFKENDNENSKRIFIIYGYGCLIKQLRSYYDIKVYIDMTPLRVIWKVRKDSYKNIGDDGSYNRPLKEKLRRCYYIDFECALKLRKELWKENVPDLYIVGDGTCVIKTEIDGYDKVNEMRAMPWSTFCQIMSTLVKYPFRCKPVYLEGVWGGTYIKRLRHLPEGMENCAWVFDLIPMEVSILVDVEKTLIDFPFYSFVQKEGEAMMGKECVEKFGGYFPIRFNYDDTFHGSGNMSIQVHPDEEYIKKNFNEHGRQDESYYVVVAGHGAKTYLGFKNDANFEEFISEIKESEVSFKKVDHDNYVNSIPSKPGMQFMIPAGTIHASGRNQLVLEIGSLTVGSYTFKLYDYLRPDLDGIPRPIHTYHGERVLKKERRADWVSENIAQSPRTVRQGDGWQESIVGEHDLLYFSLRTFEFEKEIEDCTNGRFHVLTLVDGEKVRIESIDNPHYSREQEYLEVVVVPASIGRYRVVNLGNQPVVMHKTMLKDGFNVEDKL